MICVSVIRPLLRKVFGVQRTGTKAILHRDDWEPRHVNRLWQSRDAASGSPRCLCTHIGDPLVSRLCLLSLG
jgi:hypothetical protein